MTENLLLDSYLKRLKLPTVAKHYSRIAEEAARSKTGHIEFLVCLLEQELSIREANTQKTRLRQAGFPFFKALDSFDFSAAPFLNQTLIMELYRGEYVSSGENIVFLGSIGTGKTHLSIALGAQACLMGKRVKFFSVAALVNELVEAQNDKKLSKMMQALSRIDLLILDELGMVPFHRDGANLLFQVLSSRYERRSTIITTNLEFKDWTHVFGTQQLTAALLDRITHKCHIIEANGDSYRFKESIKRKRKTKEVA